MSVGRRVRCCNAGSTSRLSAGSACCIRSEGRQVQPQGEALVGNHRNVAFAAQVSVGVAGGVRRGKVHMLNGCGRCQRPATVVSRAQNRQHVEPAAGINQPGNGMALQTRRKRVDNFGTNGVLRTWCVWCSNHSGKGRGVCVNVARCVAWEGSV